MGDSAIVETIGLGAFAMVAAPAVVCYLGAGRASQAATIGTGVVLAAQGPQRAAAQADHRKGIISEVELRRTQTDG
jgi:hypothetical protein